MAVTEIKRAFQGATSGGTHQYVAFYLVKSNDPRDQAERIKAGFVADTNIAPGMPYQYGNDRDLQSYCKSVTAQKIENSQFDWLVSVNYEPADQSDEQNPDEDGQVVDDPQLWARDISMVTVQRQSEVVKAINLTTYPHPGKKPPNSNCPYTRPAGTEGAVVNSAGIPFDPPPLRDHSYRLLTIVQNEPTFDSDLADEFADALNNSDLEFVSPYHRVTWAFKQHQMKCVSYTGTFRRLNNFRFWEVTREFLIKPKGETWLEDVLDRGQVSRVCEGEDDGAGGVVSASDLPTGVAPGRAIRDFRGAVLPEVVLFNGQGQPIGPGADFHGLFFTYRWDEEKDFTKLNIGFTKPNPPVVP